MGAEMSAQAKLLPGGKNFEGQTQDISAATETFVKIAKTENGPQPQQLEEEGNRGYEEGGPAHNGDFLPSSPSAHGMGSAPMSPASHSSDHPLSPSSNKQHFVFYNSEPMQLVTDNDATSPVKDMSSSRFRPSNLLGSLKRRRKGSKGSKKKSGSGRKDDDEEGPSSLDIRKEHLRQLAEARPRLTERQVEVIVQTWDILQRDIAAVGTQMFTKLFETYPGMKDRFGLSLSSEDQRYQTEISKHGVRVLKTVDQVLSLRKEDPEKTIEALHDLGSRHITFNAKVDFIDLLGQNFLFAIEPVLQEHWTPEVEQAWGDLFHFIAHVMKEAMIL